LSNPVVANSSGVFPSVYWDNVQDVRVRVREADGTVLGDADPYFSDGLSATSISFAGGTLDDLTGAGGAGLVGKSGSGTVQDAITASEAITARIRADNTSGNLIFGSTTSGDLLNNTVAGTKNGDINTAFGIQTMVNATSSYACAAFGYGTLFNLTTGHSNTALGYQAGLSLTTGIMNTLVGVDAMFLATAANYNTVVGHHCMNNGIFAGEGAVVIGQQTARNLTTGNNIIAIGRNAMANSPATGSQLGVALGGEAAVASAVDGSVVIGNAAAGGPAGALTDSVIIGKFGQFGGGTVSNTVQIGAESMFRATGGGGDNNATLGYQAGYSIAGTGNVLAGYRAGYRGSNTTVNSAVCIGNLAGFNAVTSGDLYIGNSDALAAHLIWGNFGTQVLQLRSNSLRLVDLPTYADNAAAVTGGEAVGTVYKTATGELRIVV
jgi:hypothetical protein